jgi:hypothetical protein
MSLDSRTPAAPAAPASTAAPARRRFLTIAGTAAVAVPVMETLTGHDLLTTSAKAQTAGSQAFDGPLTGTLTGNVG